MKIVIYDYLDYQAYLQDWYKWKKEKKKTFSYQKISEIAGFQSRSYAQRVITGTVNLSPKSAPVFSIIIGHNEEEAEYFKYLVAYRNSKQDKEKFRALRKIQQKSNKYNLTLEAKRFEYFNTWYHPVIRELVTTVEFDNDFQKLGRMLNPTISAKNAHASVDLLVELGLIKKMGKKYAVEQNVITAQQQSDFLALRNYQQQLIRLGAEAIDRFDAEDRNIVTITAGVSLGNKDRINKLVSEFTNQLIDVFNEEQEVETTIQLNMQSFPLSVELKSSKTKKGTK